MKHTIFREVAHLVVSSLGIILLALSLNYMSWMYKLVSGGLPGYALVFNYLGGFSVGTFLLVVNTIVLLISFFVVGKTAGLRGIYGYVLFSVFVDTSRAYLHLHQTTLPTVTANVVLIIAQGVVAPIAIALVMANGYSFGSYSSMMPIVRRFSDISAPRFFLIMDSILIVLTFFLFGFLRGIYLLINAVTFFVVFRLFLPFAQRHLAVDRILPSPAS